ncbi:MAG: hypothetical protein ACPGQM_12575 [Alphaproteobacteria bacterium]
MMAPLPKPGRDATIRLYMIYNAKGPGDKAKHDLRIAAHGDNVHDISVMGAGFGAFF